MLPLLLALVVRVEVEPAAPVTPRTASGAPKLVCRRSNDPNTRLPFDSSELLDARDAVLESIWGAFVFTSVVHQGIGEVLLLHTNIHGI